MSEDKNSDSSDEEIIHSRKSSKCKAVLDSDDENDHAEEKHIENHIESSTNNNINDSVVTKPILSNYKALIDSDSSSEDEADKQEPQKKKFKVANSSDDSDISGDSGDDDIVIPKNYAEPKEQRKSAAKCVEVMKEKMSYKKAEELKQTIQSEKQRMERDAEISVPYHRPKQHTLKEFLARKTAITSSKSLERFRNMKNPMQAIKVNKDQQDLLLKQSKERQEESEEFFSNCVSDDEENVDVDIPGTNEHTTATDIDKVVHPNCDSPILSAEEVYPTESLKEVQSNEIPVNSEPEDTLKTIDKASEEPISSEASKEVPTNSENVPILPQTSIETDVQESFAETMSQSNKLGNHSKSNDKAEELMKTDQPHEDPDLQRLRLKYSTDSVKISPQVEANHVVVDYNMFNDNESGSTASTSKMPHFSSLQGKDNEDMIIDLVSGEVKPRKLTGPESLREQFMQNMDREKIMQKNIEITGVSGFSYQKLKNDLMQSMLLRKRQRAEIQMKAEAEAEKANQSGACGVSDSEVDTDYDTDDDAEDKSKDNAKIDAKDDTEDEEEEEEEIKYVLRDVNRFLVTDCGEDIDSNDGESAEDSADSEEESDSSFSEEETENVDLKTQSKGRIITAFVDSDDEDSKSCANKDTPVLDATENVKEDDPSKNTEELIFSEDFVHVSFAIPTKAPLSFDDIFATQNTAPSNFSEPSYSEELASELKSLCDPTVSQVHDDDLLEICSGQFAATQATDALFTQRDNLPPSTQDDNELMLLCSGQFVTQANDVNDKPTECQKAVLSIIKKRKLRMSSSDEDSEPQKKVKRKKKKSKRKKRKLGFSDDEETVDNDTKENKKPCSEVSKEEEIKEAVEDEEGEIFLDYDSEENEVEVKLNKKQRIKAATEYFENEADLSGSEWGSADEDEQEMDKLMTEMGDEEQFDQDKLKEEVGRIHMRKMLDDDLKNVKKITNLLFDDEENDGADRERKFRWKNNTEGFNPDDENARDADGTMMDTEELDEDNETLWRKIRHERETILAEQSQKAAENENNENNSDDILLLDQRSQTVSNAANTSLTKRKFQIIKMNNNVEKESKKESPFLISKSRGSSASFLARDVTTLNKLANFTKNATDDVSNVGSGSGRGNQFVFTTLSPSVVEKKKRLLENIKKEFNPPNPNKLIEKTSRKKLMLLDQLNGSK